MLIAASLLSPAVAASPGPNEAASAPPDDFNTEEELGWDTNLDLVKSLTGLDECLFRHSVFPAGGVGYEDSSLPYEGFDAPDAALLTLRAEALRMYPGSVMDVVSSGNTSTVRNVTIVAVTDPEGSETFSLDALQAANGKVDSAIRVIESTGVEIVVDRVGAPSLLDVCAIEDQFRGMKDDAGEQVTVFTQTLPLEHVVEVIVNVNDERYASAIAKYFGSHVRVTTMEGRYELASRTHDDAPVTAGAGLPSHTH